MQQILEETLTKNMHLQQSLDQISQVGKISVVYSVSVANLTSNSNLELHRRIMVNQIYFIQCSGSDKFLLTQPVGMASQCTKGAKNFYVTLVMVFIKNGKRKLAERRFILSVRLIGTNSDLPELPLYCTIL
jgi:hypothetical protein